MFPIFSNKLIRGINIGGMTIPLQVNYCPVESLTPTNGPSGRIDNGGNKLLLFKPGIGLTYCPELVDHYNRFQFTVWQRSLWSVTLAVQFPSDKKGSSRISGERLSDFQKEVFGIPVAIAHSLQQFDFVVHPL